MAMAPTCLTCGSILMGYGWDKEMNFPVYFCTECSVPEKAAPRAGVAEEEKDAA